MDMTTEHKFTPYTTKSFGGPSPVARAEPMIMGSPSSPTSSHNNSQYLPGFLLGDQTPGPSAVHSPLPGVRNIWPSNIGNGSSSTPKFSSQHSVQSSQVLTSSKKFADRIEDNSTPSRCKDKMSAPPVSGLLDTSMSSSSQHLRGLGHHNSLLDNVESKHQLTAGFSSPLPSSQHNLSLAHLSHSTPAVVAGSTTSVIQSTSQAGLLSPPQVDPFYTQGEELSPYDVLDETWVTVFGFAKGAVGHILQQFNEYGAILDHVVSNDGNWMHIHYKSKIAAKKALSKNGKVIGNNMMVGVRQCIDQSVMRGDSKHQCSDDNELSLLSVKPPVPLKTLGSLYEPAACSNKPETPIRSLTKAYQLDTPTDVHATDQKNDAWWKKAMEYAFGW